MSLGAADFTYVTTMIRQRSSIDLQPGKEYLVESRLAPIARQAGETDVAGLVARLRRGDAALTDAVVDALTTNETSWFRDAHPFDAFTNHLLPDVAKSSTTRQINIWSAACSSGQEAYSLAMLLLDWLPLHPGYSAKIIGTDISPKMVERARAAKFSQLEVNRGLRAPYLVKYFEQQGRDWILKQPLRDLCRFERGNLATPAVGVPTCDIVFLRNVLIYFDLPTKRTVLTHVRRVLRPGGFLVLGGAESTLNLDDAFQRMELGKAVVFRHTGGKA
ncbi:protein-glutamate O-methyltransferase CheR [Kineosporia sp. A_224]|uniref:CheR family methyltransferase n=1 Tax=Kineosporia sp. A_224 TaxID=1962180 RepID=UPI000B4BFEAC|nr:protein-glutamate O-methyltransferase CheR [Kineosporia sp. A_224]